jgi:homoserine acetyltransferase
LTCPDADTLIVLMSDPNWNGGFYYDRIPPHAGLKLARRKQSLAIFYCLDPTRL